MGCSSYRLRNFSEMLEETIRKYQNRTIEVAQVIAELVKIAKQFKKAMRRGEELGLNDAELAFYDALETNDSAVMELGDGTLKASIRLCNAYGPPSGYQCDQPR